MSTVQEIESAIVRLNPVEQESIRNWLDELVEERLELNEAFREKIQNAQRELAGGIISRVRHPAPGPQ